MTDTYPDLNTTMVVYFLLTKLDEGTSECPDYLSLIIQVARGFTYLRLQHQENTTSSIRQGKGSLGKLSVDTVKALEMTHLVAAPVSVVRSHGCPQLQQCQEVQSPHTRCGWTSVRPSRVTVLLFFMQVL